jgi:predicted NAD/FAD-dependent oxidoreductase
MTVPLAFHHHVAVVGGGITGACAASTFASRNIKVDVFDQGRSGPGGRASHRVTEESKLEWDHGCQFFRADTERFRQKVEGWIEGGMCQEWFAKFGQDSSSADFFGLPGKPPFFVGMKGLIDSLLNEEGIHVYSGQRVSSLEREGKVWKLLGVHGEAAFHDTSVEAKPQPIGSTNGYDAVVLTDVSSSFDSWHRASAGVPAAFAARVRERAGSRVPLFSAMVAFEQPSQIPFDATAFDQNESIWFAAKTNSKPGMGALEQECWTIISTPEYAMRQISEIQMQDKETGAFQPQTREYLTSVPGPDLERSFRSSLKSQWKVDLPKVSFLSAQRWGSALPAHRLVNTSSDTRQIIAGVAYDSKRGCLAPTEAEAGTQSFLADDGLMLFQAGDMVSSYSPGFEGAAISGMDAAEHICKLLS